MSTLNQASLRYQSMLQGSISNMTNIQSDISGITHSRGVPPIVRDLHTENCKKLSKLSHLIRGVGLLKFKEGKQRFSQFVENGHRWNKDDYDHDGFRAVYCRKLFVTRAVLVNNVLFQCALCLPGLLFDTKGKPRSLKVASFGCGPAGELAGFETYFEDLKKRFTELVISDYKTNRINYNVYSRWMTEVKCARLETVTGYDSSEGWREYSKSLRYAFVHQYIDHEFVKEMEPVDILIMSYFVHNAGFLTHADGMGTLDILQQKTKMIIFIDICHTSPKVLDMLNRRGFTSVKDFRDEQDRDIIVRIWYSRD